MKKKKTKKEEYDIERYKPFIADKQTEKIMLSIMKEEFNREKKKEKLDKSQDNVLIHKAHCKIHPSKKVNIRIHLY